MLTWCYAHDMAIVPRGGGTGYAARGGAGGRRRARARAPADHPLDRPASGGGWWPRPASRPAACGSPAREYGLYYPPNPGALEQSHIGGNVATNAGGPHCFKHGVTRAWVQGLEVVVAPGEVVQLGGHTRKDVAGYDLVRLLVGSEGTLGVITAVWLRLIPAPEARYPILAVQRNLQEGIEAIGRAYASGAVPAAIEYLDGPDPGGRRLDAADAAPRGARLRGAGGGGRAARGGRRGPGAHPRRAVRGRRGRARAARRGVGRRRLALARGHRARDLRRARRQALRGHRRAARPAGGGDRREPRRRPRATASTRSASGTPATATSTRTSYLTSDDEVGRAKEASAKLFEIALRLGGTISGEHGVGRLKAGHLRDQWPARAVELHGAVKAAFDPKGLLNPGAKLP